MDSLVYIFLNNDIPNVWNTGSQELTMIIWTSFNPYLQWLEDPVQEGEHMSSEEKDGLSLDSYKM